ncbi:pentatricopeptide repeat-containing protein At5g27110-like isoform X2 [Selaginella moellendorffii]|nr:pentatricopeptide repeat-containing protein At5g27110-like isoform X2 [Selaginella moellendorffii]|eukprot:XP_024540247.1 pentatricopeptide repeat-containing protein At5g27110-like isoform X2 [Selaginella moellendorffii]
MPLHDLVSSTALMLGYAENSQESLALELLSSFSFHSQGIAPDATLFVAALKACSSLAVKEEAREIDGKLVKVESLERAMAIHSLAAKFGCEFNLYVATTLVDVYAKCKSVVSSQRVFDRMPCHNAVSWTSLMMGYIDAGNGELAIDLFSRMELASSSSIDAATFVSALKACSSLSEREEARELDGRLVKMESLKRGVEIHARAEKSGWELDASVGISLVDMYAKCGCLVEARRVFDRLSSSSVVPLTSLTLGYAENGQGELAVELLESKVCEQGGGLDPPTFVAALKACSSMAGKETGELVHGRLVKLKALEKGMSFHSQAMDRSFETDTYVANTLVDMYARCGSMVDSRGVFDRMVARNSATAASWNALLLGYSENGEEDLSLELFPRMLESEAMANSRTFGVLLKACGAAVALDKLQAIEARIYRAGLEVDETLATSLVDVYGKCGDMIRARCVFDWIVAAGGGDLVLWTALIAGYSRVGKWKLVFESFSSMEDRGLAANAVTLVCLLTACSHSGLVERGRSYFREMVPKFGISPGVEHLSCMVDLLSRANHLDEAVEMAKSMPAGESGVAWMTILGACSKWRNVRIGEIAFGRLVESDSHSAGAYDLMANIYGRI